MHESHKKNILVGFSPDDKRSLDQASYRLAALWGKENVPMTTVIRTAVAHLNASLKSMKVECR